jgi:hypothetical protein
VIEAQELHLLIGVLRDRDPEDILGEAQDPIATESESKAEVGRKGDQGILVGLTLRGSGECPDSLTQSDGNERVSNSGNEQADHADEHEQLELA